jgi:2,4-dienoyl-CoA reductase-like NADH-dependent reductase (Old Yellow Enzyme family)
MSRYPLASRPLTINGCELRNRIVRTGHHLGPGYIDAAGLVTERMTAYLVERARGGVGLSFLGTASVHPSCPGGIFAYRDEQIEAWARLADGCHAEGMKVFQQLFHYGPSLGRMPVTGKPVWAADTGPRPGSVDMTVGMSLGEIDELVEAFGDAAWRVKQSGLDGIEVHGAHGYLLADFLSPLTNHRTDDYGGSPENRARLLHRCVAAARERVGPDFPVGVRLSASEWMEGGFTPDDILAVAQALERDGLIDFVDVSTGSYFRHDKIIGAMHEDPGYELADSRRITGGLSVPTIVAGRLTTLAEAEAVLAAGDADLVSFVRALIADPHMPAKSFAGREAEVRPCINCNQRCIGNVGRRAPVACVVNVEVGFELEAKPLARADRPGRVIVVGGGPAGMEAARTAALRGHDVVLYEAEARLGGNIAAARLAPYRGPIGKIVDFQAAELARLGVEVRLSAFVTPETARGWNADAVILATGAAAGRDGRQRFYAQAVPGLDLPHVRTVRQVLEGDIPPAARALVYDDFGDYPPLSAAERLLEQGLEVVLASSEGMIGSQLVVSFNQAPTAARLQAYPGFSFLPQRTVRAITPGRVELGGLTDQVVRSVEADLVVLWTAPDPRRELEAALAGHPNLRFVGDAVTPGDLGFAIRSGHEAGLAA